ncbi:FecR family protein [Gaoshiqia sediminis]|uniref:DUF4974 domain-containing protein n=1 Tax=Gaoshiqia sediminis TaxID=2986998 RepID=A0AA41YDA0_9BACT|nr:FecR domain-containing protein [Gaoshiqia sediminis]MCW0484510.1 DUF4974 domain-containing protein [Gaoshiqia sediminis]
MKNKPTYYDWTFKFLEGKLTEAEEIELWSKINGGEYPKEQFLKDQQDLKKKIIASENPLVDKNWRGVTKKMEAGRKTGRAIDQQYFGRKNILAIAAAFVFGIIIASAFYFIGNPDFSKQVQQQEVYIPYGAKTRITLPDGSAVWLNSGSKLSYPSVFNGERSVHLEGEAYFDVVKSKVPFQVATHFGQVEVLGTSFNVKSFSNEEFQATLVEGSVRLSGFGGKGVLLNPGELASFTENSSLVVTPVDTNLFTSWKDGKLIFYREPFSKVAVRLERWYNVDIEIEDEELNNLWFTGTIEMETFTEFMELIVRTYPIHYTYDQNTRILKIEKK